MKRLIGLLILLTLGLVGSKPASAQGLFGGLLNTIGQLTNAQNQQQGVIVRTTLGLQGLKNVCLSGGCTVVGSLRWKANQLFLVRPAQGSAATTSRGRAAAGDRNFGRGSGPDSGDSAEQQCSGHGVYGSAGIVGQHSGELLREHDDRRIRESAGGANYPCSTSSQSFGVSGSGIVADIDTGVDPNHPALQGVLLPGYDFTRNQFGGSELTDVSLSVAAALPHLRCGLRKSAHGGDAGSAHGGHAGRLAVRGIRARHDGAGRHSPGGADRKAAAAEGVQRERQRIAFEYPGGNLLRGAEQRESHQHEF